MEQDFSAQLEVEIPRNEELAKQGKVTEALENLVALEKQTRQGGDIQSTTKVATTIILLTIAVKDYKLLNNYLLFLAKRRGQEKQVIKAIVQEATNTLSTFTKDQRDIETELITTLRNITEGKIFVENERARLTLRLAAMKEEDGLIEEAARIIQEIAAETYSSMDKREKTSIILDQVRLCLDSHDPVRANILQKKISKKLFEAPEFHDLKVKYFTLMTRYYAFESDFLEICRCYLALYQTPSIANDPKLAQNTLKMMVVYVILAPYGNEQHDLAQRINAIKALEDLPVYQSLLKNFLTLEIMRWPHFHNTYARELAELKIFETPTTTTDSTSYSPFEPERKNLTLAEHLHKRVVAHNVRIISQYYSRITTARLAELLDLSEEETEKCVSELVVSGSVFAKIDRPLGQVGFTRPKDPNHYLNDWSHNVSDVLDLIDKACHLINRETVIHSASASANA